MSINDKTLNICKNPFSHGIILCKILPGEEIKKNNYYKVDKSHINFEFSNRKIDTFLRNRINRINLEREMNEYDNDLYN